EIESGLIVRVPGEQVILPQYYRDKVERHWDRLIKSGKTFFNGPIYTIIRETSSETGIALEMAKTDYAHFLYTLHTPLRSKHDCRVIYTSSLVVTQDGKYVIGIMGRDTFAPGKLQLIGGGLDESDIHNELADLDHSVKKELKEELGIDADDRTTVKDIRQKHLKAGGAHGFMSVIYKVSLILTSSQVLERFERHCASMRSEGQEPEIKTLVFVNTTIKAVRMFTARNKHEKDENLIPVMMADASV
ncbi:MAG TPA: NUDIX hydrolase, partial [Candidatus Edwardsbacteria bacterium]|nr:NUDIX hydrolase [Candidatus Edwardsbacteria bacterium]